jgi:hypothetical protein
MQTFISANGWVKLPVACHLGEIDTLLANGNSAPVTSACLKFTYVFLQCFALAMLRTEFEREGRIRRRLRVESPKFLA